jgi:TRAP-type C4-dicarboxylate transport system permease small subunit
VVEEARLEMKFIKPMSVYIFLVLILLASSSFIWQMLVGRMLADTSFMGYPLHFYTAWGPCPPGAACTEFNLPYLILDIIFWLIVSAILIELYKWRRSKRANKNAE